MLGRISLIAAAVLGFALFVLLGRPIFQELTGGPASIRGQMETRAKALEAQLRANLPQQANEITKLVGVEAREETFHYFYSLSVGQDEIGVEAVEQSVFNSIEQSICSDPDLEWMSRHGMTFVYSFIDKSNELFAEVPVPPGSCGEAASG
ncbi:MAG: hypothetical protein AAF160_02410 [Pseudomonadota bacterium]